MDPLVMDPRPVTASSKPNRSRARRVAAAYPVPVRGEGYERLDEMDEEDEDNGGRAGVGEKKLECDLGRRPTVSLVRRVLASPALPILPRFASNSASAFPATASVRICRSRSRSRSPCVGYADDEPSIPGLAECKCEDDDPLSPSRSRPDESDDLILPTPDFSNPTTFLPRGLGISILSTRPPGSSSNLDYSADSQDVPVLPTPEFGAPTVVLSRGLSLFGDGVKIGRAQSPESDSELSVPFLPLPDLYSSKAKAQQLLARGLGVLSRVRESVLPNFDSYNAWASRRRSQSIIGRLNSEKQDYHLVNSLDATDRFTHKWPYPSPLRGKHATADGGLLSDSERAEPWTGFKWCLLLSVSSVFIYGGAALIAALMTWFRTWDQANVMSVADNDLLILITLSGAILIFTALVGLSGVLLNARPILAVYTLLLWPALASMAAIGYVAYKRATFALDHKLNLSWSQYYTPVGRLLIQDALHCCGFYSALHEATPSKQCYPRTPLPGCKGKLYRFERGNLILIWESVFSLVLLHLVNMVVALVCANHVTEMFGRGIMPERYRLTGADVQRQATAGTRVQEGMLVRRELGGQLEDAYDDVTGVGDDDMVPFLSH